MQVQNQSGRSLYKQFMLGLALVSHLLSSVSLAYDYNIQEHGGRAFIGQAPVSPAYDYNIQDLGENFIPLSISDSGLIVGKNEATGAIITKTTDGSIVNDLGSGHEATQINDNNFVTGYIPDIDILATPIIAALWENGLTSPELSQFSNLTKASAVNGFNEIVGTRRDESNYRRPFHYDMLSGRLTTLGTLGGADGWANDVNESGYLVGSSVDKSGNSRAFRYTSRDETLTPIPPMDGYKHSEGWKINDDESVVGWVYNDTLNQTGKRAFYNALSGKTANLGTLGKDTGSVAWGINNHGLIVGQSLRADGKSRAFLFDTTSSDIVIVVVDPLNAETVYAHSTQGAGILRSKNKGDTWQVINTGLINLTVNALLIHPTVTNILYAGTDKGFFRSANGGNNWEPVPGKLEDVKINALYFDIEDKKRIFAGTDAGIYYSLDEGLNWTLAPSSTGFATYNFVSHKDRPETLFAATSRGVYSSSDRGVFWSRQNGQDSTKLLSQTVTALAIDPNDPDWLYAATAGGGVFKADIAAGSLQWKSINDNSLVYLNVYALQFYDDNGDSPVKGISTLFAGSTGGIYKREIGSAAWEAASSFGGRGGYSLALAGDGSILYASSFDGDIFRSDLTTLPLASNWASITRGVSLSDVYALNPISKDANDPTSKTHILAGASNGFFRLSYKSSGDSTTWNAPQSGASGMKVMAINYDNRTAPYTLWAGSSDQGVLISHDNGNTWSFSNEGLDNWNIYALAVDTTPITPTVFAATAAGVYRSDDGGVHWSKTSDGLNRSPVYSLLLDNSVTPALLYAGTQHGVYRSSDYGRFWVPMNLGIDDKEIITLQLTQGGTILAGSISGGLFVTSDNGQSWQANNNGTTILPIFDLAEDPFMPGNLLAATAKGIYQLSCTTTCTWGPTPFLGNMAIMAVRFDPDNANHIYAGTEANGIQVSKNLGSTWQAANDGITSVTNRIENLNNLLDPAEQAHWNLQDANDINNNGEIIGWGYRDVNGDGIYDDVDGDGVYDKHGYLLSPAIGTSTVDLAITQTTQPGTIKQGIPFNYHIAITNRGPDAETSAKVIDWLPPDIVFRVASSSQGHCEKRPENIVRCELGGIPAGETAYVNISMESPYRDVQIHNIARVKGNERDADFSNNTTTAGNTVTIDKCFIATAAYGSFIDPHVTALRHFRDNYLLTNPLGREFVAVYYRYSPPIASFISGSELLRGITRLLLAPIVYAILYPLIASGLMIAVAAGIVRFRYYKKRRLLNGA